MKVTMVINININIMSYPSDPSHCSKMGNLFYDGCIVRHVIPKRTINKVVDGVNCAIETQECVMTGTFVKNPTLGDKTLRGEGVLGWTPELGGMISVDIWIDKLNRVLIPITPISILTTVLITVCEMAYLNNCCLNDFYFNTINILPSPMKCSSNCERAWLECEYEHDGEWKSIDTLKNDTQYNIINACIQCGVDMGECNPRQYCRKTYCPN